MSRQLLWVIDMGPYRLINEHQHPVSFIKGMAHTEVPVICEHDIKNGVLFRSVLFFLQFLFGKLDEPQPVVIPCDLVHIEHFIHSLPSDKCLDQENDHKYDQGYSEQNDDTRKYSDNGHFP